MKHSLLALLFMVAPICVYGQYNNYDLNSYINPDFKRKSLDINFNSSGDFEKNNQLNNNKLNGNMAFTYNNIISSRKLQENMSLGVSGLISNNKSQKEFFDKLRNNIAQLDFNQKAHYYFTAKHFYEISPRAQVKYQYDKATSNSSKVINARTNSFRTEVEVDLGYGFGRIENVTDARQAIYILEDLQAKGVLKKTLTTNEINELAHQMSIIKNKRQFDAREKAIDELTFVNNYLISENYIDSVNTADYFFSLNDLWGNGDNVMREAGHRFKFGLAPTYIYQGVSNKNIELDDAQNQSHINKKNIDTKWGGTLYIDYAKEKPINLRFQRSFNIGVRNGLYRWRTRKSNEFLMHAYTRLAYGYFLDTRTYIEGAFNQHFYWNHTPESRVVRKLNTLSSDSSLDIKGYYFLSGQLKMFASCSLLCSYYREIEPNATNYHKYRHTKFEFGIQYSIF